MKKTDIECADFLDEEKTGPGFMKRMFFRIVDSLIEFLIWFLEKIPAILLIGFLVFIIFGVTCAIREQRTQERKMVENGWKTIDTKSTAECVEAEILARERARNDFGDSAGKYAFHYRVISGTFFYKAHPLAEKCEECGKDDRK